MMLFSVRDKDKKEMEESGGGRREVSNRGKREGVNGDDFLKVT